VAEEQVYFHTSFTMHRNATHIEAFFLLAQQETEWTDGAFIMEFMRNLILFRSDPPDSGGFQMKAAIMRKS